MSIIGTATSAMSTAIQRFDDNAAAIARAETAEQQRVDLAKQVAETIAAKAEVQANAAVARTGSKMIGSIVDILA